MMHFPFKRLGDRSLPTEGKVHIRGELVEQMEALGVAGVMHLKHPDGQRQYFLVRLPDTSSGEQM